MKVVALVSGGKDSTFNMMLCVAYGHELVAFANLHPPADADAPAVEEMDSFMYQTAGHALIPALAECAGLPLFRQPIRGSAVQTSLAYAAPSAALSPASTDAADEVEDLLTLLRAVLMAHPDVRGVSVGAIASDYQRVRVESVCERLGLTSLCYLWRQDQAALLDRMIGAGVDAVLCKVACLGLSPRAHLGRSLSEVRDTLHELNAKYGCHVCGEGGEYETLTRWCPLFTARLELGGLSAHVLDEGGGFAPVAVLRTADARVQPVEPAAREAWAPVDRVQPAPLRAVAPTTPPPAPTVAWAAVEDMAAAVTAEADARTASGNLVVEAHNVGRWLAVSVSVGGAAGLSAADAPAAAAAAVSAALRAADFELRARRSAGLTDALLIKLYLADMGHYGAVNGAFAAELKGCAPPARAAVALPLRAVGAHVLKLELLARRAPDGGDADGGGAAGGGAHKRVLHVQSVSEWAPRMIGPYAQAAWAAAAPPTTSVRTANDADADSDDDEARAAAAEPLPTLCCSAGAIGLYAPLMTLVEGGAAAQTAQALANVDAVLDAIGRTPADTQCATLYTAQPLLAAADADAADEALGGCAAATAQLRAWSDAACASASPRPAPLGATLRVEALPMSSRAEILIETMGLDAGGAGAGEVRGARAPAGWRWVEWTERVALEPGPNEHAAHLVLRALWRETADGAGALSYGVCHLWGYVVVDNAVPASGSAVRVPLGAVLPAMAAAAARLARARAPLLALAPLHASVAYAAALGGSAERAMRAGGADWAGAAGDGASQPGVLFFPVHDVVDPVGCCVALCVLLAAD